LICYLFEQIKVSKNNIVFVLKVSYLNLDFENVRTVKYSFKLRHLRHCSQFIFVPNIKIFYNFGKTMRHCDAWYVCRFIVDQES
jgi:hypothetical protein